MKFVIPKEVKEMTEKLVANGYQAYLVGGCVRDTLFGLNPKDWDIATDAHPAEVQKIFPLSVYENGFGTVGVKTGAADARLKIIEVTTFRIEGKYTDKRHPDEIKFAHTIQDDLSRRDFTVNAIALKLPDTIVDPYDGQEDLKNKIIRTVGEPKDRFNEDALRLMRAVRLAVDLDFEIEKSTGQAIKNGAGLLEVITKERIRDELKKIIMTPRAAEGVQFLEDYGLLRYIMPEIREGIGCTQNKHHIYTVFEHNLRCLNYAAEKGYSFHIRLAAFLSDVGKPRAKRGEGLNSTFYNHEVISAKMTVKMLDRLRFPKDLIEKVVHLVRSHMFYYNVGEVTEGGVRRFLNRVGPENIDDLIKVREADRIGSGVPKAVPYKIRHLLFMIEKVKHDPISPKMLKVRGDDVMRKLNIGPGPKVGRILSILLEEILDDPNNNSKENLESRIAELGKLSDKTLDGLHEKARMRKDEFESGIEKEIKRKYYVK